MNKLSTIALLAALCISTAALGAGVTVNAGAATNGAVTTNAAGANTAASTNASVGADANTSSVGVDASASAGVDASASASVPVDASSSMMSSASDASMASQDCSTFNASSITTTAIDATALAGVTTVTVFDVANCGSVPDLAAIDGSAQATLGGNAAVTAALQASGSTGDQIVGYMMDKTSLTVYVRKN